MALNDGTLLLFTSLLLLFLRPLVNSSLFPRIDYFMTLSLCMLVVALLWVRRRSLRLTQIDAWMIAFIATLLLSSTISHSTYLLYIFGGYVAAYYALRLCDQEERNFFLLIMLSAAVLVSLYGVYQYWIVFPRAAAILRASPHAAAVLDITRQRRSYATFSSPNALAGYLSMAIFIPAFLYTTTKNRMDRLLLLVSGAIMLIGLAHTKSLLSFCILATVIVVLLCGASGNKKKKIILTTFLLIVVMLLVGIFMLRTQSNVASTTPHLSIQNRLIYLQEGLSALTRHPFLGIGLGKYRGIHARSPHNAYLLLWIETGILPLIALMGIITTTLRHAYTNKHSRLIACAVLVFILHNLFETTLYMPEVAWVWWALLGNPATRLHKIYP